ncbi:MAG: hypothetical protein KKC39_08300 [Candidatus Omnitrophica bacterium]|nr:hypothetical protein [Candidatus Omnitrophota bacterium]MBU4302843.1 hypothetical protein [Candidatus Omnitrophota bacterium]MBU4468718.1 hypothetical protein [Candidatus Omnitrophota bacterium]MCG2707737.1 hypothetical protein [Candidatus Omnitrophota bacterium]
MAIKWEDFGKPEWTEDQKEQFIKNFEVKIWPDYYQLFKKQSINALAVNFYEILINNINVRIDFEIAGKIISIFVFPWHCVHKPESIKERFKSGDEPWLIGRFEE